jgi:hypothetical protein
LVTALKPWVRGPFELLVHAEAHVKGGRDFDRRMAVISYDNAIEVAIHSYLNLHPIQRRNREYENDKVQIWLQNYHTKIDFFLEEVSLRELSLVCDKAEFVWYHKVRNDQYHKGEPTVPQGEDLQGIREAALWVFSVLFDIEDTEQRLAQEMNLRFPAPPQRDGEYDEAIDQIYEKVVIEGRDFSASEILFAVDDALYRQLGADLCDAPEYEDDEERSA